MVLCEDMRAALEFAAILEVEGCQHEFTQARLFPADANAMLHILIQMEMNKQDANLEALE